MYFNNCKTNDEAKDLFRKLCKNLHPDKGGNEAEFIRMYKEFENFKPSKGESFNAAKFYNLIKLFEGLENIKISFVGCFVWLEDEKHGATYEQRENIKNIKIEGYNFARFHRTKKCWYFSPSDYIQKSKTKKSLEEIKNTFGCESFKTKTKLQLT